MLAEELQIYKDTFQLCKLLTEHTKNVSREVKFTDYADIRRDAKNALNILFIVNSDIQNRVANINMYLYYVSNVKSGILTAEWVDINYDYELRQDNNRKESVQKSTEGNGQVSPSTMPCNNQ